MNDTEKKLALIWRQIFTLSEEELQNLEAQASFLVCGEKFCEKLGYSLNNSEKFNSLKDLVRVMLTSAVDSEFDIWSEGIANCKTLGEQAVYVDCCLAVKSKSDRPVKMQYELELPKMSFLPILGFDEPKIENK